MKAVSLIIILASLLIIGVVASAPPNNHQTGGRIINGDEAQPHSIPFQALLQLYRADGSGYFCGGSLISPTTILTAGHCAYNITQAVIILGAHKLSEPDPTQLVLTSSDIVVHEEFDIIWLFNDIALIRLSEPVQLTPSIQLARLPSPEEANKSYVGEIGRASGWGSIDISEKISDTLQFFTNEIMENKECLKSFDSHLQDYQICLGGEGLRRACYSDDGGPLTVDGNVQIGIYSFGMVFCIEGYPSVFTRTGNFLDWIAENSVSH